MSSLDPGAQAVIARQGWNAATVLDLAVRFLGDTNLVADFTVFLEETAAEENAMVEDFMQYHDAHQDEND